MNIQLIILISKSSNNNIIESSNNNLIEYTISELCGGGGWITIYFAIYIQNCD